MVVRSSLLKHSSGKLTEAPVIVNDQYLGHISQAVNLLLELLKSDRFGET